jgi:RNA polymerase sigma-70 factor (ECF subfamily)
MGARLRLFIEARLGPRLRDREEPMDLVQETYLAAHRAFAEFDPAGRPADVAFRAWLCRIAEHCICARADHHGARKRTPPAEAARISRILEVASAGGPGPMTAAGRADASARLLAALDALPVDQREVVLLRQFEGLSLAEIARRTDSSESTVRRRFGLASRSLGVALGPGGSR